MKVSPELEQEIESCFDKIKQFEVTYKNGGIVVGTSKKIKYAPLKITLLKLNPAKGERPKHKVVFDHVVKFSLVYANGKVSSFE